MVAFLEHTDTSLAHSGVEVDLVDIQDQPVVLLSPFGDILLANKVRIIEMSADDLDPEEAEDLADLDRIENELRLLITWLGTMPDSEDREYMLDDLRMLLEDVPYAREMLALEAEAEAVHEAVEV